MTLQVSVRIEKSLGHIATSRCYEGHQQASVKVRVISQRLATLGASAKVKVDVGAMPGIQPIWVFFSRKGRIGDLRFKT